MATNVLHGQPSAVAHRLNICKQGFGILSTVVPVVCTLAVDGIDENCSQIVAFAPIDIEIAPVKP